MSVNATGLVVRKSLHVDAPVERAWEVFTERIAAWWPLRTHSIHQERAETVVLERHEGGRMYERSVDGAEAPWGTVLAWEPPHRLAVTWFVNPERHAPTEWEVRFEPEGAGTRVDFEHRGWERYDDAVDAAAGYTTGWELILERYAEVAGR